MRNFFSHRTREILWIILFAVLSYAALLGSIVIPPEDVTGKVGETAVFECEVDWKDHKEMVWTFNRKTIYSFLYGKEKYPLGRERYSVTQDGRTFELSIKDLQYSDGGEYRCDVPSQVSAAHLVVIGPPHLFYSTVTRYSVEGTTAKFVCTAEFGGPSTDDIPPGQYLNLQMFLDGTPLADTFKEEHLDVATRSYNLTQNHYTTLKPDMDGKSLMCKTETSQPDVHETVVIKLIVQYSVRNIRYTPEGDEHKVGTTLTCTADGNPQPNFIWTDTKNKTNVIHGPSLQITEEMVGSNAWRCNATNNINGSIHKETLVAVFQADAATLGSIVIPPEDVTGKLGETAVFECEIDWKDHKEMVWTFNRKTLYSFLYGKEKYLLGRERYSVTQDGRTFKLSIKDLQYSDGGEYRCDVPSQVSAAHLVVIGPLQLYSTVTPYQVEGTTAKFICKVEFGGPSMDDISPGQYPKMQIFLDDTPLLSTIEEEWLEVATSSYNLTQIHNMTLKSNMDGKSLMCKIKTVQPAVYETVMIKMIVLYWVRDIRYTPEGDEHKVGTTINCTADGNPQPNFIWTDTKNKTNVIHSPSLRITEEMVGSNAWRCAATNAINGSRHEETLEAVFQAVLDEEDQTNPDSWKLPTGIIVLSSLVIGCLTALYVKRKKISEIIKRSRKKSELEGKLELADGSESVLLLGYRGLSIHAVINSWSKNKLSNRSQEQVFANNFLTKKGDPLLCLNYDKEPMCQSTHHGH